jgi:ubiquinone/menaquinone biosynthesis C-methylase UbiE
MSSERLLLEEKSPWWGEHYHRYLEAMKYVQNDYEVLDIACGTGYGSNMLADKAKKVIAADIDETTIAENKSLYDNDKLSFQVLDGTNLPFPDESLDLVVSFETIEHTTAYREMLLEFRRVLKKGSYAIISTPNKFVNSPDGVVRNPYHTQEWTPNEFDELIGSIFDDYELYGQLYTRYKNNSGFKFKLGNMMEKILLARGIRKIPLSIQDSMMNLFISTGIYPTYEDYEMTQDRDEIADLCVTQLAIVKK